MTTARELVNAATAAGAKLAVSGDTLSVTAPRPLAPELVEQLRAAKAEILKMLAAEPDENYRVPAEAAWWRRHFAIRTIHWGLTGRWTKDEAERFAWGELQCRWHRLHGERVPASTCAGCGKPIADTEALDPGDGTRVHFATAGCLIRYGECWRSATTQALLAMGLTAPCGPEHGR